MTGRQASGPWNARGLSSDDIVRNMVTYQFGWFMCVLCAIRDAAWAGVLIGAILISLQLASRLRPGRETLVVFVVAAIGGLWETALVQAQLISYAPREPLAAIAPVWMFMLWALFASTLNVSMRWLHGRPWLAALFGALGGPAAYAGGERIGALTVVDPTLGYAAIAIGWALLTPALLAVARAIEGIRFSFPARQSSGEGRVAAEDAGRRSTRF
jgi:Protein of unknown function (DUF2878)